MLNNFFRRINLIQTITIETSISKEEFEKRLTNVVDRNDFFPFEIYSNRDKLFVGRLNEDGFKIKPKIKLFDFHKRYLTRCLAKYKTDKLNNLTIYGDVYYLKHIPILYIMFLILMEIIMWSFTFSSKTDFTVKIGISLFAPAFVLILYIILRAGVDDSREFIEAELKKLTKKTEL